MNQIIHSKEPEGNGVTLKEKNQEKIKCKYCIYRSYKNLMASKADKWLAIAMKKWLCSSHFQVEAEL